MNAEPDRLLELAASLADGEAKDWEREARVCDDPRTGEVVRALGFLASVREAHESLRVDGTRGSRGSREGAFEDDSLPRRWGPLELVERVGRGSFGTVYRARDPGLDRFVAVKLRRAATGDDAVAAVEEGRLLAQVRHPNVVAVHGAEQHDGHVGMWMEFIEGETLEQRLGAQGPFGAGEALSVGVELCGALAAVHAAGLVHGDVKTQNVMRERGGRLVLMDFGSGSRIDDERCSAEKPLSGTPLFMAPEVLAGRAKTIQADVYAVGVVLYRLLGGRFPVRATSLAELRRVHETGASVPLRDLRPDLPIDLLRVVARALDHDPARRHPSVGALEEDLLSTRRGDGRGSASREAPSRSWSAAALVAAALLAVAVIVGFARVPSVPPASPLASGVEVSFRKVGTTADLPLADGDRVRPGDQLYLTFDNHEPVHLYVVNLDRRGHGYLLFPLPEAELSNPLPAGRHRLPGSVTWDYDSWEITSAGGRESFVLVAARRPLERLETVIGKLRAATPDGPLELGAATVEALRGAGRLSHSHKGTDGGAAGEVAQALRALATSDRTEDEIYLREIVLRNP